MRSGERIFLVGRLAARLNSMAPPSISSLLDQVGFRSPAPSTNRTGTVAIVEELKWADNSTLIALYEHFFNETYVVQTEVEGDGWPWGLFRLFMSHVHTDKVLVHSVAAELMKQSISCFVAHDDLAPTQLWQDAIDDRLRTCDAMTAFLGAGFKNSDWTDQEVGYCLFRDVLIIPLRLDLTPYGFLARFQALAATSKTPAVLADEIFRIISKHPKTTTALSRALLAQFSEAPSFDEASANWSLLRVHVQAWTAEMLATVDAAVALNDQIREANWGNLAPQIRWFVDQRRAELGIG